MTFEQIIQLILGSGGALAVLVLGVKWLDKDRSKVLVALQEERDGRIKLLEDHSKSCNEDRQAIQAQASVDRSAFQKQINELYSEIVNIYKTRSQSMASRESGIDPIAKNNLPPT